MKRHRKDIQDWRRFELMVSRLERALKPTDCVFRSPDYLLDSEINELREVDCSITIPNDSGSERISIECRKRGTKQDVTWIEQLATKKNALNLAGTIAVSSRGFTRAAYLKAKHHGITLNTYREVELSIADRPLAMNHVRRTWSLREFSYEVPDDCPEVSPDLQVRVQERFASATPDTDLIRVVDSGPIITFGQIVEAAIADIDYSNEGLTRRKFKIGFPKRATIVDFPDLIYLKSLYLEVEVQVARKRVDEALFGKYSGVKGALLEVAKGKFELGGRDYQLELFFQVLDDNFASRKDRLDVKKPHGQ